MKNIVICCDGTRGKYGADEKNTNVVRMFERLNTDGEHQISYYDPGVGTYNPQRNRIKRWIRAGIESAFGEGVRRNIGEAYKYLMDHYEQGDRVFLFGYSRGAYTARALAGLLHKCGLLTRGSDNLIPYAMEVYQAEDTAENRRIAASFKRSLSRDCRPYFIGVWDTVASMGWLWQRRYFRNARLNEDVKYAYQALSVDEKRRHFRPSIWEEENLPEGQVIEQVWFSGCHCDIGGQDADRRLADIPLEWMLGNAEAVGLNLRADWKDGLAPDPAQGEIKESWKPWWGPPEERIIPKSSKIDPSVRQRQADLPKAGDLAG